MMRRVTVILGAVAVLASVLVFGQGAGAAPVPPYRDMILADGPLAYWRLGDDCQSTFPCTAVDETATMDATIDAPVLDGSPELTRLSGGDTSMRFSGNTFPELSADIAGSGPGTFRSDSFTMEMWVFSTDSSAGGSVRGDGWTLYWFGDADNSLGATVHWGPPFSGNYETTGFTTPEGEPFYLAATFDAATSRFTLTLNDVDRSVVLPSPIYRTGTQPIEIEGGYNDMTLDEVAFYDEVLPRSERLEHYLLGRGASGSKADPRFKRGVGLLSVGYAADPVNTYTGAYVEAREDLDFAPALKGLEWQRFYDSGGIAGATTGWRFSYSDELAVDGWQSGDDVELTLPEGRVVRFENDGTDSFGPAREFQGVLATDPSGWRIEFPDGRVDLFDTFGRLSSRTFWDGESVTLSYSGTKLNQVTSSAGPTLTMSYQGSDIPSSVTASDGRVVSYSYDQNDDFLVTLPGSRVWRYVLDGDDQVTEVHDPAGVREVLNTYDGLGRVESQLNSFGDETLFNYDFANRSVVVTDVPTSTAVTYEYDAEGRLVSLQDSSQQLATRTYDSNDYLTGVTDRLTGNTVIGRNDAGQVTSYDPPGEDETTVEYVDGRVTKITKPNTATATDRVTTFGYELAGDQVPNDVRETYVDSNGDPQELSHTTYVLSPSSRRVTKMTDGDGKSWDYLYWPDGQIREVTNGAGKTTKYRYHPDGDLHEVELPSGDITATTYDDTTRQLTEIAPDGGTTVTQYDLAGRVDWVRDPELYVTDYTYDATTGRLQTLVEPGSADWQQAVTLRTTSYAWTYEQITWPGQSPQTFEVETITHNDQTTTKNYYGDLKRLIASTDPLGRTTFYTYDADGNVATVTDPEGGQTESSYDEAGRVDWEEDERDRRTDFTYDGTTGQLTKVEFPKDEPEEMVTEYRYDPAGRRILEIDPRGGETVTSYTPGGRIDWIEDPEGRRTLHGYDDAGRLSTVTSQGNLGTTADDLVTTYRYDDDSNVAEVETPEGDVTKTVWEHGRVKTVEDPAGVVTTHGWTVRGELESLSRTDAGEQFFLYYPDGNIEYVEDALGNSTEFYYDALGYPSTRSDQASKQWLTDYNSAGELVSETDPLLRQSVYTYDDAGRMKTSSDPSGRSRENFWHPDGTLEYWTATDGAQSLTTAYGYDGAGRVKDTTINGQASKSFVYNTAGDMTATTVFLTPAMPEGRTQFYAYNDGGERTQLRRVDGTGVDYIYDDHGRVDQLRATEIGADSFAMLDGLPLDDSKWDTSQVGAGSGSIINNTAFLSMWGQPGNFFEAKSKVPEAVNGDSSVLYWPANTTTSGVFSMDQRVQANGDRYSLDLQANSPTATISKTVGSTTTPLATFTVPVTTDPQNVRFTADGNTLTATVWGATDPEPSTPSATATDSDIAGAGSPAMRLHGGATEVIEVGLDNWSHIEPGQPATTLVDYEWDDDGHLDGETLAGGGTRDWTWTDGQLTGLNQNIPGAVLNTTLEYDTSGRIWKDTTDGITTEYGYDDADQLKSATPTSGPTQTWDYNTRGHRILATEGTDSTTFAYDDAGQLTTATPNSGPATSYVHDGAGRRTSETTGSDTTSYSYDPAGKLFMHALPTGENIVRVSDPDGTSPVWIEVSLTTLDYRFHDWDTTGPLAELTAIASADVAQPTIESNISAITRAPGTPWAVEQHNGDFIPLASDIHHSTITSTGSDLALADEYTPWGDTTAAATSTPKLGYRGELTAGDLTNLRARDYDPTTGTFTTTDPLDGVNGTTVRNHPYHYTNNNPLNLTDPTGMRPGELDIKITLNGGGGGRMSMSTVMISLGGSDSEFWREFFGEYNAMHAAVQAYFATHKAPGAKLEVPLPGGGPNGGPGWVDIEYFRAIWEVKSDGPRGFQKAQSQMQRYVNRSNELYDFKKAFYPGRTTVPFAVPFGTGHLNVRSPARGVLLYSFSPTPRAPNNPYPIPLVVPVPLKAPAPFSDLKWPTVPADSSPVWTAATAIGLAIVGLGSVLAGSGA